MRVPPDEDVETMLGYILKQEPDDTCTKQDSDAVFTTITQETILPTHAFSPQPAIA